MFWGLLSVVPIYINSLGILYYLTISISPSFVSYSNVSSSAISKSNIVLLISLRFQTSFFTVKSTQHSKQAGLPQGGIVSVPDH